jgi:hypothetical protein
MKRTILMFVVLVIALLTVSPVIAQQAISPTAPVKPIPVEIVEQLCPTVIVYQRGVADNFLPGPDAVSPSLALSAFLTSIANPGFPPVAYDENANCDHPFGDSFKIDSCVFCCGICSATLEITLRGCGSGADCNDSITIGQAPFNGPGGYILFNGYIDPNACPTGPVGPDTAPPAEVRKSVADTQRALSPSAPIVKKIPLDPRRLAELICQRKITTLDVYVQDDQIVDSMRLIITKP